MAVLLTDGKTNVKRTVANRPPIYYELLRSFKGLNLNNLFAWMLADSFFFNLDAHDDFLPQGPV